MSSILRPIARASKRFSLNASAASGARSFHSPFAVLNNSSLTSSPSSSSTANIPNASHYEKHYDVSSDSFTSLNGYRTYVVSEPDASSKHYQVPAGAYPTSAPYVQFTASEAPNYSRADVSSTSADLLAHPFTKGAAPSGIGESSAKRQASAPGAMGRRGGSYGGLGLKDKEGATMGTGKLGERNPQPDGPAATKFSKAGLDNAWKMRI